MAHNSFSKAEHLYGEKTIGRVFAEGEAFIAYPLRVSYLVIDGGSEIPVRVMVSVPKKRFKRAVKRNRLKRRMREAYRQNKHALWDALNRRQKQVHIAFQYVSDEEATFEYIEKKMLKALAGIQEKMEKA